MAQKIPAATKKAARKKKLKQAKEASASLRASVSLPYATKLFADLHERVSEFVLDYFKAPNGGVRPDPREPLPQPLFSETYLEILLGELRDAFRDDPSWGVNADNFKLTAKQLMNLTKGKSLGYMIQVIYQRAHDALV